MNPLRHFLRRADPEPIRRPGPFSHVDRELAFKGAEAIGRLPEEDLRAALELLSVADGPHWRLCWPGFRAIIFRAHEAVHARTGEPT